MTTKLRPTKVQLPGVSFELLKYSPIAILVPPQASGSAAVARNGVIPPSVILMMRWMDAKDAHVVKYIKKYTEIYPEATQIVVAAPQKMLWLGDAYREKTMEVIAALLREHGVNPEEPADSVPLLLHTFSNGGCLQLISLARRVLRSRAHSHRESEAPALPATALVFDSCPAPISLASGATAASMVFRNPTVRSMSWYFLYAFIWTVRTVNGLFGFPESTGRLRSDLLDPTFLPSAVPRTYIYSTADKIVPYKAVEECMREEEKLGRRVTAERFETSGHVNHARADEGRYWGAVQRTWGEGVKR